MRSRRLALILTLAAAAGCGEAPTEAIVLFRQPEALATTPSGVGPFSESFVLDIGTSRLYHVGAAAAYGGSVAVPVPPDGWLGGTIEAVRESTAVVTITQPRIDGGLWLLELDPFTGAGGGWTVLDADRRLAWDGRIAPVSGTAATLPEGPRRLPADAAALPRTLGDAGFAYLTTDGALAWWDPVSMVVRWRAAVGADGPPFDAHGGTAAWIERGWVVTAPVDADGIGPSARAPLEASPLALRVEPGPPTVVWMSTADGALHRLGLGAEPGVLCYADRDAAGTQIENLLLRDVGALSNPVLETPRIGRADCPGWARNDAWVVGWEEVPAPWMSVRLTPSSTVTDIAGGEWLAVGDIFTAGGERYAVVATSPLEFSPVLPGALRGRLSPIGRWTVRNTRDGFLGTAAPDVTLELPALALRVRAGADAADPGDRFTFRLTNGVTPFAVSGVVREWQFLAGGQVLALDRKGAAVHAYDPASQLQTGVLR